MQGLETCGRYELIRRIAVGGMAEIYLARETGLAGFERLVIVKRILPNLAADTDFIDMFLDEARLAARLTHPNIVHIYELDEQDGTYFIAMEYVPGGDLHEMLGRRRGVLLPLADSLHTVSEVCAGLQFAHALAGPDGTPLGVVHRDVTPKNVLLSVDGVVKVMDFGIAKARAKLSVTRPGDIKGTFSYMAPEQARGERVNRRADIYAVGTLLYRLTTGSPAYPQVGNALLAAVRAGQFVRPRKVNPELPPVVEEIILRAMSVEQKDRHATCGALRRDLSDAARSLGLHGDSETLASAVREAFPRVPGATIPVDESPDDPFPPLQSGPAPLVPQEAPDQQAFTPAGPDESTGLMAMDDLEVLDAQPLEEAPDLDPFSSPVPPDVLGMDATAEVEAPLEEVDPTQIVEELPQGFSEAPPQGQNLADLVAPRTDPAARLPDLMEGDADEDQPTNVIDLEGGDDDPTRAIQTPEAAASAAEGSGGLRPLPGVAPLPSAPPEPLVVVGPATPTATPVMRKRGKQGAKKRSRRGTLIIALAFFVGAVMIAAAVTLVSMPGPSSEAVASGGADVSPAVPETPTDAHAVPPVPEGAIEPAGLSLGARAGDGASSLGAPAPVPDGGTSAATPEVTPPPLEADHGESPSEVSDPPPPPRVIEVPVRREKRAPVERPTKERRTTGGGGGGTGYLTVWTTPYSKVYLGSRLLGTTPMAKRQVPAGRHRLKLVNPELPHKFVGITVKAGEVTRVRQRL